MNLARPAHFQEIPLGPSQDWYCILCDGLVTGLVYMHCHIPSQDAATLLYGQFCKARSACPC